jgi:hypothetical protein
MMQSIHSIICKRTGEAIAAKLDGGTCACPSAAECRLRDDDQLQPEPTQEKRRCVTTL